MQVDGAVADGATARQGNAGEPTAGYQRTQHQGRCAHGLDDFVLGGRIGEHAATDGRAVLRTAIAQLDLGAHGDQELALGLDVADLGDILQHHFVFGENRRSHAGKRGIFGAAHPNRS